MVSRVKYNNRASSRRPLAVIAGGAGFLGSHLADRLLQHGYRVVCVDNLQTGRLDNISHLMEHPCFRFVRHDVIEPLPLAIEPVAEVYNLASAASPPLYQRDPVHTLKTNVLGSLNALEFARLTGARIFQASTSEVYGDPAVHPQPEQYWGNVNSFGPRSCYDEGKRAAESACYDYRQQYGVDVRVARIFNTYGPRMRPDDGRVVSNFIVQALCRQDITLYGDGQQTRSFCYVDDLVSGIVKLMRREQAPGGPVNLGNPGEFTMRELAELVIALTGSGSGIVHRDLPVDDPRQRRPDISLATALLGWVPTIPLQDGLQHTIAYFDAALSGHMPALEAAE